MSNSKADKYIILPSFVRLGDVVVVDYSDNNVAQCYQLPPAGTEAVVVDIPVYDRFVDRNKLWSEHPKPGIYESYSMPIYEFVENGVTVRRHLSEHYLKFKDKSFNCEIRRNDEHWRKASYGVFKGPLPDMPFYVGDRVRCRSAGRGQEWDEVGVVCRIDWHRMNDRCHDAAKSPYPFYGYRADAGWESSCAPEQMSLISRGNYYWWEHDKSKLSFKDLGEEAAFYYTLNYSEELRSSASGNYSWELEDALIAIHTGEGDVIKMSGSVFGSRPFPMVYKYKDLPDLSRRLREETLKGFAEKIAEMKQQNRL